MTTHPADLVFRAENLTKHFPLRAGLFGKPRMLRAVDGVSFDIRAGETIAIVGESGCGKSTTGRLATRLLEPTAGQITLLGEDITRLSPNEMHARRRDIQIVFQDPYAALNPRRTIGQTLAESLENYALGDTNSRPKMILSVLERVGLRPEFADRYPHQLSGGQRQRVGIARALILNPKLIVLDEAVSALDVSVQAQIVNLLMDLQAEFGLAYLFISHDLAVVRHISDRVLVMYLGQVMEVAETDLLFDAPKHPYTQALLDAVPIENPRERRARAFLQGDPPNPANPPQGCPFVTRCPHAKTPCRAARPDLIPLSDGHCVACRLLRREDEHAAAQ